MFGGVKTRRESVLLLGLGGVGFYLAKRLQHEEYAVTAIEPDATRLRYADEALDIRLIRGEAMDIERWREAGAGQMACVIAVTNNDAVNMMAMQIGHKFGIPCRIARVRSRQYGMADTLLTSDDLHTDLLVHPEELVAQEIVRLIRLRDGNEVIEIAGGQIQMLAARIGADSVLAGKTLQEISAAFDSFAFRVVAVARGISTIIPRGTSELQPHDQVVAMVGEKSLPEMMRIFGVSQSRRQRIMIVGGGLIGSRVAELLQGAVEVKLIEADERRAESLTHLLSRTEILQGDGSNAAVLSLAGVEEVDTFIAATGENETNIMSSLLAKNLMVKDKNGVGSGEKTIALVNKEDYLELASTIGIDLALNKKIMAASEIMKFIRRSQLISVAHLHGFDAEVVELVAGPKALITKKPLARLDASLHEHLLVGAVHRDGVWRIAVGDTQVRPGERAIVICHALQLQEVRRLFSV
jgi:trk system potassium uptake protein TrkA